MLTRLFNTSLSTRLFNPSLSTLLFNTSLSTRLFKFLSKVLFNTSPQHVFPTRLHNTCFQHFFTTSLYNTSFQHFFTTFLAFIFHKTSIKNESFHFQNEQFLRDVHQKWASTLPELAFCSKLSQKLTIHTSKTNIFRETFTKTDNPHLQNEHFPQNFHQK